MAISYTPLEKDLINSIGGNVTDITSIGDTSFFASTSFIYTLAFVIIIVTASFRYAYAGTLRLPGGEQGIRKSKEEFTRVTYGLLGVLGLWLILFTVNKDMLTGDVTLSGLALKNEVARAPASNATTNSGDVELGDDGKPVSTTNGSETANRAALLGIATINKPACVGANTSCTNLADINPKTIELIINLKRSCPACTIYITGGTEGGHSTNSRHGPNKEAIDIAYNQELLAFLKLQGVPTGKGTRCDTKYGWGGYVFWDEETDCDKSGNANSGRHFHASFTGR